MRLIIPSGKPVMTHGDWRLYEIPARDNDSFLWQKFKLIRVGAERRRGQMRACRLAWNCAECRFGKDRFLMQLEREQPEVFAAVNLFLDLNYDADSLLASPEEIVEEKARLKRVRAQHKRAQAAR